MRDAQREAIKTCLYLKIACNNQPLWKLFYEGAFNNTNISELELSENTRNVFKTNKAAVSLFQYSRLKDKNGNQVAPKLEQLIKKKADEIDYEKIFKKIFYDVNYTDYLFSLPMGAGKTYLMAAFIYLDLYFAMNEPENPCFAHNFMVMAPSGLKTSIIPSLKHIKEFDPSWIIPEPTASQLKRLIKFEILDEDKSENKSNRTRNPNAQKINNYQPIEDLMGLVAITNAEKVILDRMPTEIDMSLLSKEDMKRMVLANELRDIVGKLPHLSIFIDEVHHATDGDIKLRQVVTDWATKYTFNSVMGFSGTPYLDSAERLDLVEGFSIKNINLSNVVYYYPLIDGIGNFLKIPNVKFSDNDSETIIRNGVKEFLDNYCDTTYANGTCAKLAIYCGQIETLEEVVYPLVAEIVAAYGLNPTDTILKYHGGNKQYPKQVESDVAFASLDTTISKYKIVLLVQIGKEGWDCKSLTGVILPHEGACPTNMVLQTSCRCLRQVIKYKQETALIWLNKHNADKLNIQLQQQQNITIQEFGNKQDSDTKYIRRYSRMEHMKVPSIDFYQLMVSYGELVLKENLKPELRLLDDNILVRLGNSLVHQQDMEGNLISTYEQENYQQRIISFAWWLHEIAKESMGMISVAELKTCENELKSIFGKITNVQDGLTFENNNYNHSRIRSLIRQAFMPIRDIKTTEEVVSCNAELLKIENLISPIENNEAFYPNSKIVQEVVEWDENPPKQTSLSEDEMKWIDSLIKQGKILADAIQPVSDPHPERNQTYHYIPYKFDSGLEQKFLSQEILPLIAGTGLEVFYNGDDTLTEFKINCYAKTGNVWRSLGKYVPDFLLFKRNDNNEIDKILIIETKGEGFAAKFAPKKEFMETEFIKKNNEKFGYRRFEFLYLEDTLSDDQRRQKTLCAMKDFFNL